VLFERRVAVVIEDDLALRVYSAVDSLCVYSITWTASEGSDLVAGHSFGSEGGIYGTPWVTLGTLPEGHVLSSLSTYPPLNNFSKCEVAVRGHRRQRGCADTKRPRLSQRVGLRHWSRPQKWS
jgi:hypothetical protein